VFTALALLILTGLLGPVLATGKRPLAPVLVGELAAGVVLGNTGLHWINAGAQPFPAFFTIGFAMLMMGAGTEVDIASKELREGAARGAVAVLVAGLVSVPAGFGIGLSLGTPHLIPLFIVLLAGSSAAVAFPTILERGLTGPAIAMLIAWLAIADAVTALLVPLTLTGGGAIPLALLGDAAIVLVAALSIAFGHRIFATRVAKKAKKESKHRHWALQLRVSILMLVALALISERTGGSLLVAGFAAGIVLRQFHQPHRLQHQLTGVASGFFVPAFFVLLGAKLDLHALVTSPSAIGVAVLMAVGALVVHLAASLAASPEKKLAAGLLASAQLGLPAAAAALGLASGRLSPAIAAALVAGGLMTLIPASIGASLLAAGAPEPEPEEPEDYDPAIALRSPG
jgi:Kef-type K+ transport system membrane component KefB